MTMRAWIGYGGTFDPIHCGHLAVANAVRDALDADVHLVPAADPPHKDATHADASHRARMVELAVAGERGLRVDRRELARDRPSYSIDTLHEVRAEVGRETPVVWVIGADSLAQLHRWHRWRELFDTAHVLAAGRPGFSLDPAGFAQVDAELAALIAARLRPLASLLDAPSGGIALLPMEPPRRESSTEIRRLAAAGDDGWRGQVPSPVAAYIDRHRLYARALPA
ncbi:nicotinate-nucleotide adenylyltransferase [Lysobacter sp. TY2-98]|uniref:nicotinate-nucleotide adenylyltransferase n=1 Tax=Lysobacter sp. TY2-98 TaxID=2290922 RepID=UPI000E201392|nr:nicotinate-nucleotide adenylyltransferase [Lysobacter sp. TY2-98]AXK71553.1 nicotinate-nucleotide adenylyltransferase [Lysobacter sp. TY2-98]